MGKKLSKQLYRAVEEENSHMPDSSETEGRKRAMSFDQDGKLLGPVELEPAEPEIIEKTVYRTRIVEKKPSIFGMLTQQAASQFIDELPNMAQATFNYLRDRNEAKIMEERRKAAAIRRDAINKELELERLRAKEREEEEKRQKEEKLTEEQKQVISLSESLSVAYAGYQNNMTKEEACRSLIRAFVYFIMGLKEIQNIKNACIVDEDTGELIPGAEVISNLPWGEVLQNVNILLRANPSWLANYHVMMLSEAFGRDIISEGKYIPITGAELQSCLSRLE